MCFSSISVLSLTPNKPFCLTSSWFIFDVTKGSPSELYSVAHSTLTEILQTTSLLQSEHGMLPFCEDEDIWQEGSTEGCIQVFSKAHSRLFGQLISWWVVLPSFLPSSSAYLSAHFLLCQALPKRQGEKTKMKPLSSQYSQ